MQITTVLSSLFYFIPAGIFEIGGGYLIWLWLREDRPMTFGLPGGIILFFYGVIPTCTFGRVYAAYGGIFIVLSILCGWKVDQVKPDLYDIIGAAVALIGVLIIVYWPRPQFFYSHHNRLI